MSSNKMYYISCQDRSGERLVPNTGFALSEFGEATDFFIVNNVNKLIEKGFKLDRDGRADLEKLDTRSTLLDMIHDGVNEQSINHLYSAYNQGHSYPDTVVFLVSATPFEDY